MYPTIIFSMKKSLTFLLLSCLMFLGVSCQKPVSVSIVNGSPESARASFGTEKLTAFLQSDPNYRISAENTSDLNVFIGNIEDENFRRQLKEMGFEASLFSGKEAFRLVKEDNDIYVMGADESGTLYGCMELIERLKKGEMADRFVFEDKPEMVLRGTCIGMQKPYYLPGRTVYEYPYTEETFPWFYDKEMWIKYLDMLVENRMNSLYLWNGHPFASLVKLPDYPYAVEVSDEDFKKNEEMFGFLTEEANKRGIWVIQMFYNIIVSKPFAEHHHIPTQNRHVEISPLLSDYTRKSIAAFIEKYPNVGLLVCLGEAMNTVEDDVNWFTNTIIPGVQDGLKALGKEVEPPIVLRAHDTNCEMVMDAALPLYRNLYTMNKYNGESLCTYEPRGPWTATHQALSALGSVHISNVHILANLEPFRYGSPDFIQKSVTAMHDVHGANGLHLYPQASYWDWPYSADRLKNGERLLEMDRDRIWYETWGRYAWNCRRDRPEEVVYWAEKLADKYGCNLNNGKKILEAYEQTGEISTKLLRKFGITEGNRETFLLGMFMSQLVNPERWTVYPDFANSCGPLGEKLEVWAYREWNGLEHVGETPPQLIAETRQHARLALEAIESVRGVSLEKDEFKRLKNDVRCYEAFTASFDDKLEAAMLVLRYKYSQDIDDLKKAYEWMESSLKHYRRLVDLTRCTYLYANSMQTQQRRIPASGAGAKNKEWWELLPQYEAELQNFADNIALLEMPDREAADIQPFEPAQVNLISPDSSQWTALDEGSRLFYDMFQSVRQIAPELKGLKALRTNTRIQRDAANIIQFSCEEPVTLWVGYYRPISPSNRYMNAPRLETDASANDYGQADIRLANAVEIPGMPAVNVHSFQFAAGEHTINLGRGMCLVLGFSKPQPDFQSRDAGLLEVSAIDWLFY